MTSTSRQLARPERIRFSFFDDPAGSTPVPLPARRMWPVGIVLALMLAIFGVVAVGPIVSLLVHVPRLGFLRIFLEYDLAKIRNLRLENAGGPDRVRIRFDYGDGHVGLGDHMPRAAAERRIRTIQSAIDAVGAGAGGVESGELDRARPAESHLTESARPGSTPAPSLTSASALALIGANLVPLAGVLLFGWRLGEVMTLFWAENAVIGFYNILKMGVIARWGIVFVGPFFVGHYGGFMAIHFLFLYYLFVRGIGTTGAELPALAALADLFVPLWPALLALFVSHGVSFFTNFLGRKEYAGRKVAEQMGEPYKRIIVLHLTIIFGGWAILLLRSPLPALVLLIVLKTAVDVRAHRREHGRGVNSEERVPTRR